MRQTTMARRSEDVARQWHIVDASGKRLGRMATEVATILMGKHRPEYTPHVDTGDFVIIINASEVVLTGKKAEQKLKTTFSGYPGGLRAYTYAELLERKPEQVVIDAVRRMLPKNRLGKVMLSKLKVYKGEDHPHAAQQPSVLEL